MNDDLRLTPGRTTRPSESEEPVANKSGSEAVEPLKCGAPVMGSRDTLMLERRLRTGVVSSREPPLPRLRAPSGTDDCTWRLPP